MRHMLNGRWILAHKSSNLPTNEQLSIYRNITFNLTKFARVEGQLQRRRTNSNMTGANETEEAKVTKTQSSDMEKSHINEPLTDKFGRHHTYLRISLTERCNLRCKYCMPAGGVDLQPKNNLLTTDEIIKLAGIFVEQGVRKIRLTGGEPTVRRDIVEIIERIKSIPNLDNVGITTNGLVLTRHLVPMQRAGLDFVNISLDTLKPHRFEEITRRRGWERVVAGIDLAVQLGFKPKINCVLMRNFNEDEICDFVEFTKDRMVDVRFIEYMPFTGNKWQTDRLISFKETLEVIRQRYPKLVRLPNSPNDTSKAFKVPDYTGQVGFISSMTEHFCGTCNRLRLTADGNIKVCLFGNKEFSLRDAIRNNCPTEELIGLISAAVKRKQKQHADSTLDIKYLNSSRLYRNKKKSVHYQPSSTMSTLKHLFPSLRNTVMPQITISAITSGVCLRYSCFFSSASTKSPQLTHVDTQGKAAMVDVSQKTVSERVATARASVFVGKNIIHLIASNNMKKGDVLTVVEIAGILGAKKTAELIPLCHNIALTSIRVNAKLDCKNQSVELSSTVRCNGQTGVEMEALTAVTIAALTVYDMCKAVSHDIVITNVKLRSKTGGKADFKRCTSDKNTFGS